MRCSIEAWRARVASCASSRFRTLVILALAWPVACGDGPAIPEATGPAEVHSVEPWSAAQGETIQVRVRGSGFTPGDVAVLERGGSAAGGVVAQTAFLSSTELVVTLQVGASVSPGDYDLAIHEKDRKKGIATEMFNVLHGTGSTLAASLSFSYVGDRTGSFAAGGEFVLDPSAMSHDSAMWGITLYEYSYAEQFIMAQQPAAEGPAHFLMCWSPGGRVHEPGVRPLECWIELGLDEGPDGQEVFASYSSWIGGSRPSDGTGTVTFTSVTGQRLAGTFRIVLHADNAATYPGPLLHVEDGQFDLPIVSTYFFDQ